MNGVEILSTAQVVAEYTYNYWLAGFIYLGTIFLVGTLGFLIADSFDKVEGVAVGCLLGALIGLLFWLAGTAATSKPVAYETRYKVTIDDSVSMNEFLEKYEILDQEGKIYTVKERE